MISRTLFLPFLQLVVADFGEHAPNQTTRLIIVTDIVHFCVSIILHKVINEITLFLLLQFFRRKVCIELKMLNRQQFADVIRQPLCTPDNGIQALIVESYPGAAPCLADRATGCRGSSSE